MDADLRRTVEKIRESRYDDLDPTLVESIISAEERWIDKRSRAAAEVRALLLDAGDHD